MDKRLKEYLKDGECSAGREVRSDLSFWREAIASVFLDSGFYLCSSAAGTLAIYLAMDTEKNTGVIALLALVALVLIASPLVEQRNLRGQHYWITNQRVILMCRDHSFFYIPLQNVDVCKVVKNQTEWPCLAIGSAILEDVDKQLRWRACHPKVETEVKNAGDCAVGMIFYGIKNADAAMQLLQPYTQQKAA